MGGVEAGAELVVVAAGDGAGAGEVEGGVVGGAADAGFEAGEEFVVIVSVDGTRAVEIAEEAVERVGRVVTRQCQAGGVDGDQIVVNGEIERSIG